MAMAASKALGALSTETDIQRARGSRQTTGPPLEAECLAIVREAQTNTRCESRALGSSHTASTLMASHCEVLTSAPPSTWLNMANLTALTSAVCG